MTTTERLFAAVAVHGPRATEIVTQAFVCAAQTLQGAVRWNGDPYIVHAVAVAVTVAEAGADLNTIVAALLHSAPDEQPPALEPIRAEFGESVTDLLTDFLTLHNPTSVDDLEGIDTRAVLITIAHRLHTMQTIQCLQKARQQRKADETRQILAPAARRLGFTAIATELDTLATPILVDPSAQPTAPQTFPAELRIAHGLLQLAVHALLPGHCRQRWLAEWDAELHQLPGRRDKLTFTLSLIFGLPYLARHTQRRHRGVDASDDR